MDSLSLSQRKRICLLSEWIAEVGALSPSKHWTKAIFSHLRSLTENNQTLCATCVKWRRRGKYWINAQNKGKKTSGILVVLSIATHNCKSVYEMAHNQMRLMDLLEARDHMCNVQNWRCIVMCVSWVRLKNPKKMSDEGKKMDFQQNEKRGRMQSFK